MCSKSRPGWTSYILEGRRQGEFIYLIRTGLCQAHGTRFTQPYKNARFQCLLAKPGLFLNLLKQTSCNFYLFLVEWLAKGRFVSIVLSLKFIQRRNSMYELYVLGVHFVFIVRRRLIFWSWHRFAMFVQGNGLAYRR